MPLSSPTGVQWSPRCLRRPPPARMRPPAAVSSGSNAQLVEWPLGSRPSAAAEGSPEAAQGSESSGEATAHALPACHPWLRGRRRGRRGRWATCSADFGGLAARSRVRVVRRAAIFQVAARLIFASKWSFLCCSIRPGPAWTDPRRRESRSGQPGPQKRWIGPERAKSGSVCIENFRVPLRKSDAAMALADHRCPRRPVAPGPVSWAPGH